MKTIHDRILRMPTDDSSGGGVISDPLDTNVNDVDTSFPLLPATYYSMQIGECKVEPNSKQTGDNLVIPLKTTEKVQDVKGQEVNPGFTFTHRVSLTETPKYDINAIKKGVARVAKAAGVSATVREIINNPSVLNGKFLPRVKLKVNKETPEFGASNSVASFADE